MLKEVVSQAARDNSSRSTQRLAILVWISRHRLSQLDDKPRCLRYQRAHLIKYSNRFTLEFEQKIAEISHSHVTMTNSEDSATTILVSCKQTRFHIENPVYQEVIISFRFHGQALTVIAWHWRSQYHGHERRKVCFKSQRKSKSWGIGNLGEFQSETEGWCPLRFDRSKRDRKV